MIGAHSLDRTSSNQIPCSFPNEVPWYLDFYCPLIKEIAALRGTEDLRTVDKALFSYGGNFQFPN